MLPEYSLWLNSYREYELHFSSANPVMTGRAQYEVQPIKTKVAKSSLAPHAGSIIFHIVSKIQLPHHFSAYLKFQLLFNGAQDSSFSICYWLHAPLFSLCPCNISCHDPPPACHAAVCSALYTSRIEHFPDENSCNLTSVPFHRVALSTQSKLWLVWHR